MAVIVIREVNKTWRLPFIFSLFLNNDEEEEEEAKLSVKLKETIKASVIKVGSLNYQISFTAATKKKFLQKQKTFLLLGGRKSLLVFFCRKLSVCFSFSGGGHICVLKLKTTNKLNLPHLNKLEFWKITPLKLT